MQNKIFTDCQSGFIPYISCIAQLLSITHETYKRFDCNPPADKRGIFLDISKAFDKVWHESLIFKLKTFVRCLRTVFIQILPLNVWSNKRQKQRFRQ